jgi:hypothetical protein
MSATVGQIESIIIELKKLHKMSDAEILNFMVKTGSLYGKDWCETVTLKLNDYLGIIRLLIEYIDVEE